MRGPQANLEADSFLIGSLSCSFLHGEVDARFIDKLDWRAANIGCGRSLNAIAPLSLALLDKTLEQFPWRIRTPLPQPVSARQCGHTGPWSNPRTAPLGFTSPLRCIHPYKVVRMSSATFLEFLFSFSAVCPKAVRFYLTAGTQRIQY